LLIKFRIFARRNLHVKNFAIGCLLLVCWTNTSVIAATNSWRSLTFSQREALAPLAQEWDTLTEAQRSRWLDTAQSYSNLNPDQKKRFNTRLGKWSKLTHEQREAAREKYKAFQNVPAQQRQEVKQMVNHEKMEETTHTNALNTLPGKSIP
jgi:hypothetical protein